MWDWIGFRQCAVPYVPPPRYAGESKYTLKKMLGLAGNAIMSFSRLPLRMTLALGVCVSMAAMGFGIFALIGGLVGGGVVPGWASLAVITSFGIGFQLVVLGVLGEYVGRIYEEVRDRPIYIVRLSEGFVSRPSCSQHWSVAGTSRG
jgi:dolichol-phosphate mannosyltransferase